MWGKGFRDDAWKTLSEPWDLVVVGGGITGAGILSEATRAGFRTLLVEGEHISLKPAPKLVLQDQHHGGNSRHDQQCGGQKQPLPELVHGPTVRNAGAACTGMRLFSADSPYFAEGSVSP